MNTPLWTRLLSNGRPAKLPPGESGGAGAVRRDASSILENSSGKIKT
jgi:hypothetical protein